MSIQAVGPKGVRIECDGKGMNGPWPPMMTDLKTWDWSSVPSTVTLLRCRLYGWNNNTVYEPLMKHWNRRKKKYPLDPILRKEQLWDFLYSSLGNAYALKTGDLCKSSGSGNSQKHERPLETISRTTSKTINLPPVSRSGLKYDIHTHTKSIEKQRATG